MSVIICVSTHTTILYPAAHTLCILINVTAATCEFLLTDFLCIASLNQPHTKRTVL